jgi:Plasmid replication region DNA-binding N-term
VLAPQTETTAPLTASDRCSGSSLNRSFLPTPLGFSPPGGSVRPPANSAATDSCNYRTSFRLDNRNRNSIIIHMETRSSKVESSVGLQSSFQARAQSLQARVNESAKALFERGIRPTVARVRAALGGGSPNDLTPALKHWKEAVLPTLSLTTEKAPSPVAALPLQVADLVHELWQRAMAAAVVEIKGGPTAQAVAARTAEAQALRQQLEGLREQLQRESLAYGELRAQGARHEAIARHALARAEATELRERALLREVGVLRQKIAELEAGTGGRRGPRRSGGVRNSAAGFRKVRQRKVARGAPGGVGAKRRGVRPAASRRREAPRRMPKRPRSKR